VKYEVPPSGALLYNAHPLKVQGVSLAASGARFGPAGGEKQRQDMFENLTDRLTKTLKTVTGQAKLTEDNIKGTLREVRMALLEADVALPVVKEFVNSVKDRAVGQEVSKSLTPGQVFVKIVQEELVKIMGEANEKLNLAAQPPAIVLMAGLQGAGKTTSVAKLARTLRERDKKKVLVVSADVYRPAAIKQLEMLAGEVAVDFFPSSAEQDPVDIAMAAIAHAKIQHHDVVLVDTAGRLHVDGDMMDEIKRLHSAINPVETLFVVDAMTGQDAAATAKAFSDVLPLTGVILTKADGDARGGAALSVRYITGKPIKFIGVGEKVDALEAFHPDRVASRILGMGDVLSLIEEAERKIDKDKAEKFAQKIKKGKGFDLEDFRQQIQQMKNMGGMAGMLDKLPGMGQMGQMGQVADAAKAEKGMHQMESIINSMTPGERSNPDIISGSRKRRIALGSGTQIQDVNRLLKQHKQMAKMMKKFSTKGGMAKMMRGMKGMLPPGMGGGGGFPRM
jgi:signal recognition particle subunit SRP54